VDFVHLFDSFNRYARAGEDRAEVAGYIASEMTMGSGIIKRWDSVRLWGIIYSPGGLRYFLHRSKITSGTPEVGRFAKFEIGPARSAIELPQALNVIVGDRVQSDVRGTAVRQ